LPQNNLLELSSVQVMSIPSWWHQRTSKLWQLAINSSSIFYGGQYWIQSPVHPSAQSP